MIADLSRLFLRSFSAQRSCLPRFYKNLHKDRLYSNSSGSNSSPTSSPELHLSDNCVERLKKILKDGQFLRIFVESGGCQGFSYKFDLDNKLNDDDAVIERDNCRVVVDCDSIQYIRGSIVDYSSELIRSSFRITSNPLSQQSCSCGSSFTLKLD